MMNDRGPPPTLEVPGTKTCCISLKVVAAAIAVLNSAMFGRPTTASSAATTFSNGLDDVTLTRSRV
jgi:hypothetical protein